MTNFILNSPPTNTANDSLIYDNALTARQQAVSESGIFV